MIDGMLQSRIVSGCSFSRDMGGGSPPKAPADDSPDADERNMAAETPSAAAAGQAQSSAADAPAAGSPERASGSPERQPDADSGFGDAPRVTIVRRQQQVLAALLKVTIHALNVLCCLSCWHSGAG